jgi:hypothetical protein
MVTDLNNNTHLLDISLPGQSIPLWSWPALIQAPINTTPLSDIYCVGEQPMERWRSFMDVQNWQPSSFHDALLKRKAYHARIVLEMTLLESFTDCDW